MYHEDSYSSRQRFPSQGLFFKSRTYYLAICNLSLNFYVSIHLSKERSLVIISKIQIVDSPWFSPLRGECRKIFLCGESTEISLNCHKAFLLYWCPLWCNIPKTYEHGQQWVKKTCLYIYILITELFESVNKSFIFKNLFLLMIIIKDWIKSFKRLK